ncbi:MAG: hypothetical protein NTV86_00585 [Planctomycetota bacterium]|nr:hypothetical protein [Planctomycetota bacterium]
MALKDIANLMLNLHQSAMAEQLEKEHQQSAELMHKQAERDRQHDQAMKDLLGQQEKDRANRDKSLREVTKELGKLKKEARKALRQKPKPRGATRRKGKSLVNKPRNEQKKPRSQQEVLMAKLLVQKQREEARLKAIADTRQDIFECRKAAEALAPGVDSWATYCQLAALKERISKVDVRWLTELTDKEYHDQTLVIWNRKYSDLLPDWSDAARAAAEDLFALLPVTTGRIQALQRFLAETKGVSLSEASLVDQVEEISVSIHQIEALLPSIPRVEKESLPGWPLINQTGRGLILRHRHNMFVFRCAVLIAKADGPVDKLEAKFLNALGVKIHLTPGEVVTLIKETESVSRPDFAGDTDSARTILKHLLLCASVDGKIDEQERFALLRIASVLGLEDEEVTRIESEIRGAAS